MSDTLPSGFQISENQSELPEGFELNETKYGGIGGSLKSMALGAASGATLGLSDVALSKSGLVHPETMQGLQEENPGSYMTGQVAGTIGSMIAAPEAAPAALLNKAGKATYTSLKAIDAMKIAAEGTQAAKVLGAAGNIAAHAAGSAVEGAAFSGIGNTLNEYALGDPNLNGEKIMGNFGKGALWGGALGAALKGASIAAPPALKAAKEGMIGLRDLLIGTGENGSSGLIGRATEGSKFSEAMGNRMTNLNADQQTELLNEVTGKLNEVHNNTQTATKNLNESLRPQEIDALIDTADPKKVNFATQDIINEMNQKMEYMEQNPGLFNTNAIAKLDKWRSQIVDNLGESSMSDRFNLLKDVKQGLGNWGYGIMDATKGDTRSLLTGLSKSIGDKLKDPDIFGFVGSSYDAHDSMLKNMYEFIGPNGKPTPKLTPLMTNSGSRTNPRWQFDSSKLSRAFKQADTTAGQMKLDNLNEYFDTLKQLPEHLENTHANIPNDISFDQKELSNMLDNHQASVGEAGEKYLQSVKNQKGSLGLRDMMAASIGLSHPIVGAAIEAYNIATHPFAYMNSLAEVERIVGKTTNAIESKAKDLFIPGLKVMGKMKGIISEKLSQDSIEKHRETKDELSQLVNNPEMMINKLNDATSSLHEIAPDTTAGLQQSMIKATQFLVSKLPIHQEFTPFEKPYEPSQMELSKFNRYLSVVQDPMSALDQMKRGTLGPETIETLTVVYPSLYENMKQTVLKEATNQLHDKTPIPYQMKQQISFLLGKPIDQNLTPQNIQMNQIAQLPKVNPGQGQSKPSKAGMDKMTIASRTKVQQEREA